MGRESPINVTRLLEPIAGEKPAGEDPRVDPSPTSAFQSLFSAQQRARKEERTAMMMGTAKTNPIPAWGEVFDLAHSILAEKSKDLHVAVFLLEAGVRRFGLPGLRDGLIVVRGLIEKFWDQLYPVADEDGGFEKRMSFLRGLDGGDKAGTLIAPLQLVTLITVSGQPDVTLQQYGEEPEGDAVKAAIALMKPAAATDLAATARACKEEFAGLRDLMQSRCGDSAPPTRNIEEAIQQLVSAAGSIEEKVAPPVGANPGEASIADTDQGGGATMEAAGATGVASGPIKSRAQALAMLDAVALFFQRHDPHSFVSYGAAEVARWGRMPLPQLLAEMLPGNDSAREALSRRLGVVVQEAVKSP